MYFDIFFVCSWCIVFILKLYKTSRVIVLLLQVTWLKKQHNSDFGCVYVCFGCREVLVISAKSGKQAKFL